MKEFNVMVCVIEKILLVYVLNVIFVQIIIYVKNVPLRNVFVQKITKKIIHYF